MSINKFNSIICQRGVGLIEVLVALFILAVGLLGVLAMQANGLKSNQRAEFSTEAYMLALDMADRIQAYDDINSSADDDDYADINIPDDGYGNDPGCAAAGCNDIQQKALDVYEWGTQLARRLPAGTGTVEYEVGS